MAGTGIRIELQGLPHIDAVLGRLANADLRPLLDALGAEVETQTRRRISEEKTSPDGTPWTPWSESYAATRHGGQSLLQSEGHLRDSIQYQLLSDNEAEVAAGSNLAYAAIHQFGGEEVGKNVPARPYLGLSDADVDDLAAVARAVVEGWLQ